MWYEEPAEKIKASQDHKDQKDKAFEALRLGKVHSHFIKSFGIERNIEHALSNAYEREKSSQKEKV